MERKIGEIFEYNGEWYQCVKSDDTCNGCVGKFQPYSFCNDFKECVGKIFKKLEKVGEPFSDEHFGLVQKYELKMYGYSTKDKRVCFADGYDVFIKPKQTKEDMEEKKIDCGKLFSELPHFNVDRKVINKDGYAPCLYQDDDKTWIIDWCDDDGERIITVKGISLEDVIIEAHNFCVINNYIKGNTITKLENISYKESVRYIEEMVEQDKLKPFDLEAAQAGKPVCTRDGRKARIICFDKEGNYPIVALVEWDKFNGEFIFQYNNQGESEPTSYKGCIDLMMLPEKRKGWVNVYNSLGVITFSHNPFDTKEEALASEMEFPNKNYVDTVKVEWKE